MAMKMVAVRGKLVSPFDGDGEVRPDDFAPQVRPQIVFFLQCYPAPDEFGSSPLEMVDRQTAMHLLRPIEHGLLDYGFRGRDGSHVSTAADVEHLG
jgi:hypothetical protein